jgi:hypothetical protein
MIEGETKMSCAAAGLALAGAAAASAAVMLVQTLTKVQHEITEIVDMRRKN